MKGSVVSLPLTVAGKMVENFTSGCSIDKLWNRTREAAFEAAYKVRVGAGMTAATEETRRVAGSFEVDAIRGI